MDLLRELAAMPVPPSPISQFLYLCYDAPIVMALFLREGEDPSGLDWQRSLDFVQMLLVAFLALLRLPVPASG